MRKLTSKVNFPILAPHYSLFLHFLSCSSILIAPVRVQPSQPSVDYPPLDPNEDLQIDCAQYIHASTPATAEWFYTDSQSLDTTPDAISDAWVLDVNGSFPGVYVCVVSNQYGSEQVAFRIRAKMYVSPTFWLLVSIVDLCVFCFPVVRSSYCIQIPNTAYTTWSANERMATVNPEYFVCISFSHVSWAAASV